MGLRTKYYIGQEVKHKNQKAVIVEHDQDKYKLFDPQTQKPMFNDQWIAENKITPVNSK